MKQEEREASAARLRVRLSDRKLRVVAQRIGMTYAALSRIMRGGTPNESTIKKLEAYLDG